VLIHAVIDALLGAARLGDIGRHFKRFRPCWRNRMSESATSTPRSFWRSRNW
jgi:2C-methyl-D-erythritol 2,4-cyclodiphosphate synthase